MFGSGAFCDIAKWRQDEGKEDFAILNCSIGLEGDGPHLPPTTNGITIDRKERNRIGKYFILSISDLLAADSIAAQIMNLSIEEIRRFPAASELGLGEVSNIELAGVDLADLIIEDWKKPILQDEGFFQSFPPPGEI